MCPQLDVLPPAAPEVPSPQPERADQKAPDTTPSRPSRWAALLARIYEVFPLVCPTCQEPLTFISFLTDPEPITQILAHIGEPTSPPLLHPARGPPQTDLAMGPMGTDRGQADEAAQESFPDNLDQTPGIPPPPPFLTPLVRSAHMIQRVTERRRALELPTMGRLIWSSDTLSIHDVNDYHSYHEKQTVSSIPYRFG